MNKLKDDRVVKLYDKHRDILLDDPKHLRVRRTTTEAEEVTKRGPKYIRIHIPDHQRPREAEVQLLINIFRNHPDYWMHFHCKAGRGRTTTAMIMRDIHLNAKQVPLGDILQRNMIFGGVNLSDAEKNSGNYRYFYSKERWIFYQMFYQFCIEPSHGDWIRFLQEKRGFLEKESLIGANIIAIPLISDAIVVP